MPHDHLLSAYSYHLPPELIAQQPADKRENSRLMVMDMADGGCSPPSHHRFSDIARFIGPKDILVINNTRVFPARLLGNKESGGKAEIFLLQFPAVDQEAPGTAAATALIKASKRPKIATKIHITKTLFGTVLADLGDGKVRLQLNFDPAVGLAETLRLCGQVPLPPYIERRDGCTEEDVRRYQTVYASTPGAVAAPTAGLHFSENLLRDITDRGTLLGQITLHVGYGTFAPVREEDITLHRIHHEHLSIPQETVDAIDRARQRGGKIWAVGTTTVRALEYAAKDSGELRALAGWCDLYIYPGFRFRVVDNLITNFHLPDSSLMFLVAALCGRKNLLDCYETAVKEGYRFFSYGDAMAIVTGRSI